MFQTSLRICQKAQIEISIREPAEKEPCSIGTVEAVHIFFHNLIFNYTKFHLWIKGPFTDGSEHFQSAMQELELLGMFSPFVLYIFVYFARIACMPDSKPQIPISPISFKN